MATPDNEEVTWAEKNKEVSEWMRFGMRLGVSVALHPFEYSRVLIQLGYEPIAPVPGRSLFGKKIMLLPNIFQYTSYIRKIDGFYGCYRGLAPKLAGSLFSMIVSERTVNYLGLPAIEDKNEDLISDEELYLRFRINLKHDVVLSISGIIASHPFHVISVRMMAQFIGHQSIYKSIIGSIIDIYRTDGLLGFFSGLVPKLICDVACVVLTSSSVYLCNKYFIKDKLGRQYNACLMQYFYASLLYPLNVVSTCMAVTGSPLKAGQLPFMPEYKNWLHCFSDLHSRNELKRGSSMFLRSAGAFVNPIKSNRDYVPLPTLAKYQLF